MPIGPITREKFMLARYSTQSQLVTEGLEFKTEDGTLLLAGEDDCKGWSILVIPEDDLSGFDESFSRPSDLLDRWFELAG
jgi:hypothetical protein